MILQGGWRDTIIKKKFIDFFKMLALAVGLICIYKIYSVNDNKDEYFHNDIQYSDGSYTTYDFAMGTSVVINLYGENVASGDYNSELMDRIKYLDDEIISWRTEGSELNLFNSNYKCGELYNVSDELYNVLLKSLSVCKDSGGALDISIRPLADVWKIESADSDSFIVPEKSDIDAALKSVGYENIELKDGQVILQRSGMVLDLGATGKGYALDYVKEYIQKSDIKGAVVSVGGSVLVYGSKDDNTDWHIGIRNPRGEADEMIGYLTFKGDADICVSTSGDYEKFFIVNGTRYHHILDRSTGYPSDAGLSSVTVVCENGLYSDALSTACFSLGYEKSLPLLQKYNAEAVFIDTDNNITITEGLKDIFN